MTVLMCGAPQVAHATFRECNSLFGVTSFQPIAGTAKGFRDGTAEVDGRTLFYKHFQATGRKPTAIVFMGLFTPLVDYVAFQNAFAAQSKGEGLIMFSYPAMPESLAAHAEAHPGQSVRINGFTLNDMVRDATAIINSANIRGPVTAVGYSFGAAPASRFALFHRGRVNNLVLASPLVVHGEYDAGILRGKKQLEAMARLNPVFGPMFLAASREHLARTSADATVKDHFDPREWPGIVDRQAVTNGIAMRIRSTEEFDLRNEDFESWPRAHFLLAENENPLRLIAQTEVVKGVVDASQGRIDRIPTVTPLKDSGHGVFGLKPNESARTILKVMRENP